MDVQLFRKSIVEHQMQPSGQLSTIPPTAGQSQHLSGGQPPIVPSVNLEEPENVLLHEENDCPDRPRIAVERERQRQREQERRRQEAVSTLTLRTYGIYL